jgi:hypothetical protein
MSLVDTLLTLALVFSPLLFAGLVLVGLLLYRRYTGRSLTDGPEEQHHDPYVSGPNEPPKE